MDLSKKTVLELKQIAKNRCLANYSKVNKRKLIEMIEDSMEPNASKESDQSDALKKEIESLKQRLTESTQEVSDLKAQLAEKDNEVASVRKNRKLKSEFARLGRIEDITEPRVRITYELLPCDLLRAAYKNWDQNYSF